MVKFSVVSCRKVRKLWVVQILQDKYERKKRKLFRRFVDLEKAFDDRVPRIVVQRVLKKRGLHEKLVGYMYGGQGHM